MEAVKQNVTNVPSNEESGTKGLLVDCSTTIRSKNDADNHV